MKVLAVYCQRPPVVVPVVEGMDNRKYNMMPTDHATTDRIWVLTEDWKCLLNLDIGWMEFTARRGWWLDWASIPSMAESLEKRDDRAGLIGATLHDMMFALQYPFFATANAIFRDVMQIGGTGAFRRWYKYAAVSSPIGWGAWCDSSDPAHVSTESAWVKITTSPRVGPAHKYLLDYPYGVKLA